MKKLAFILPIVFVAACSDEPAAEPAPVETVEAAPDAPSLPAPDQDYFTAKYAEACPDEEAVNTAVCRRAGMGSEEIICEFGLGEDEFLRNRVTLTAGEGDWTFADPDNICVG